MKPNWLGQIIFILSTSALTIFTIYKFVPVNQDELCILERLACDKDLSGISDFSAPKGYLCDDYDLKIFGVKLALRSYMYIGRLDFFYKPFYKAFDSPQIVRFQGLVYILLYIFLIAYICGSNPIISYICFLIFPLFWFNTFVDLGPTNPQNLLILLFIAISKYKKSLWIPQSIILALGIYIKLSFLWTLPTLIFYQILTKENKIKITKILLLSAAILAPFLFGITKNNKPYILDQNHILFTNEDITFLKTVRENESITKFAIELTRVKFQEILKTASNMSDYFKFPHQPNFQIIDIKAWGKIDYLPIFILLLLIIYSLTLSKLNFTYILCGLLSYLLMCIPAGTWAPHHLISILPWLVIPTTTSLQRINKKFRIILVTLILIFHALCLYRMSLSNPSFQHTHWDRDFILKEISLQKLDEDSITIHDQWGAYYNHLLFGNPRRLLSYSGGELNADLWEKYLIEAKRLNRNILLLDENCKAYASSLLKAPLITYQKGSWCVRRFSVFSNLNSN